MIKTVALPHYVMPHCQACSCELVIASQVDEPPPPTLDDLFQKTNTKPSLYWLPLTEDQAAKRKAEKAAAAAQAKAEELPAPPLPMAVS